MHLFIFAPMYKSILKPILFRMDPEQAHKVTLSLFRIALALPGYGYFQDKNFLAEKPELERKIFGLTFKNPVGLAAGFDKNGAYIPLMARLGFSHIEAGTVTPRPQPGNEKPRLFRLPADAALINRMGFNNDGVDVMVKNLSAKKTIQAKEKYKIIIGGNIGKNKNTPNEEAWKDYAICFERLFDHVDYFVVNVSSPNTPGLRELQEREPLRKILDSLQEMNYKNHFQKPLLLKISPDLNDMQLKDVIEVVTETKLSGIIATNTTIDRNNLKTPATVLEKIGTGGLSGRPLTQRSNDVLWFLRRSLGKDFPLIGAGGIMHPQDAMEKMNRGADLVQIYTGLIYAGPGIVKNIIFDM